MMYFSLRLHSAKRRACLLWMSILCALISTFACTLSVREHQGPQGWSQRHGGVVPHDTFPADCTLCHVAGSWNAIREDFHFEHERETGYALTGAHARAQCLRCHNDRGPVMVFAQRGCAGCHVDIHRGRLGSACADCHGSSDWSPQGQIAAHERTRFPLRGAHGGVACFECHPGAQSGNFSGSSTACSLCHSKDYQKAKSPDHVAGAFSNKCEECHGFVTWNSARFTHKEIHTQCVQCHLSDYQSAMDPKHVASGFPTNCEQCHSVREWQPSKFSHANVTAACAHCHLGNYQATMTPNHIATGIPTECEQCHETTAFTPAKFKHLGITNNCVQCHLADYQATTQPKHVNAGFGTACEQCHTTKNW